MARRFVSLGFSCQTRFSIDLFSARHQRNPFDFVVARRDAVLEALASRGASFQQAPGGSEIFWKIDENRNGVRKGDLFFWHDYPIEDRSHLVGDWRAATAAVNDKYRFLWARFLASLAEGAPTTFVLTNTQLDLDAFADADRTFDAQFGLDADFFAALRGRLDGLGAANYDILFLDRDLPRVLATRAACRDPRLRCRFGGVQKLRANPLLTRAAISDPLREPARLAALAGAWDGGRMIRVETDEAATLFETRAGQTRPIAELSLLADGYLAVFEGRNRVRTGFVDADGALKLSDGQIFRRR